MKTRDLLIEKLSVPAIRAIAIVVLTLAASQTGVRGDETRGVDVRDDYVQGYYEQGGYVQGGYEQRNYVREGDVQEADGAAVGMRRADAAYAQLSDLPTLYIETKNGVSVPDKNSDYVKSTLRLVKDGEVTVYENVGIRGRGNSTWGLAKKPYRIKFDNKEKFLGSDRANAKSWTLLANHGDKTLMRNAVAAFIGTFAGQPFTAAAEFVDVVMNGEFLGNYQISDQIEVRKKRVDITEQDEPADADSNITGGYLLEVDGFGAEEPVHFTTTRGVMITVKSPDDDVINTSQKNYIRSYINSFEAALFSNSFQDGGTRGYRQFVDESTLASWYISSELTGNVDCFWSTYIYKEKDDPKIYWGPLWDYDIAFNNCSRTGEVTRSLMTTKGFGDDLTKLWVNRMWQDPWFANLINTRWKDLVAAGIEQHVLDYIDEMAAHLEQSQRLNFTKWRINQRAYDEIVLFSTYGEGVEYMKRFVSAHVAYLTLAFERAAATLTPPEPFDAMAGGYYTIANKGVELYVDVDGNGGICMWSPTTDRQSQQWRFEPTGSGYYQIINRSTNMAVSDAATQTGSGYTEGMQLRAAAPNATDSRQLWTVAPAADEAGMGYVIANVRTGLAWNNNQGGASDGNYVISWTNNYENPSKPNRQWFISLAEGAESGIEAVAEDEPEYYIGYERNPGVLHFHTREGVTLGGNAMIVSTDGRTVMEFVPAEDVDVSGLPAGYYVLRWQTGEKQRSLKFAR